MIEDHQKRLEFMHMIFSEIMKLDLDAKTKFQVVEVLLGLVLKGASYEQIQK